MIKKSNLLMETKDKISMTMLMDMNAIFKSMNNMPTGIIMSTVDSMWSSSLILHHWYRVKWLCNHNTNLAQISPFLPHKAQTITQCNVIWCCPGDLLQDTVSILMGKKFVSADKIFRITHIRDLVYTLELQTIICLQLPLSIVILSGGK